MTRITDTIELDIGFSEPLTVTYKVDLPSVMSLQRPLTSDDILSLNFFLSSPQGKTLFPMNDIFPQDVLMYLTTQVHDELIRGHLILADLF